MTEQANGELLRELLLIAVEASDTPLSPFERGMSWQEGGQIFTLPESSARTFLNLVGRLARERRWSDRFSEEHIQKRLVSILRNAKADGPESAERLLDNLIDDLETYAVERIAIVPVQALLLDLSELEIGRVVFKTVDAGVIDGLRGMIEAINTGPDGEILDQAVVESLREEIAEKLERVMDLAGGVRSRHEPIIPHSLPERRDRRGVGLRGALLDPDG